MKLIPSLVIILLDTLLFSCQKQTGIPHDHPVPLLVKKTLRARNHDQVTASTRSYQYDNHGRLTMISDAEQNKIVEQIYYGSDGQVDSIVHPGQGVILRRVEVRPFTEEDNGNTVRWSQPILNAASGGIDSTVMTYHFNGEQLLAYVTYIHAYQFQPLQDSAVYTYTADGNYLGMQDFPLFGSVGSFGTALGWDTSRNIFHDMSRLNFILIGGEPPMTTRSEHNVTQMLTPLGVTDLYTYTYNGQGYPLTIRLKGENFDANTYEYNK